MKKLYKMNSEIEKMKWSMFKAVEKALLENGGIIFGGYVRDKIIHDHFANMFYTQSENVDDYSDPENHRASWPHRCHMPRDIDVVVSNAGFKGFKAMMASMGFRVKQKLPSKTADIYSGDVNIQHTKCYVTLKTHPLLKGFSEMIQAIPIIEIDVLHKDEIKSTEPIPFGKIDFECNSLLIVPGDLIDVRSAGVRDFVVDKHRQINRIIEDVLAFKAVAVFPQKYRTAKMLKKGFKIVNNVVELIPRVVGGPDGLCLICHEDFKEDKNICHVKNKCCEARYHPECYSFSREKSNTMYNNVSNCMMCRGILGIPRGNHLNDFIDRFQVIAMRSRGGVAADGMMIE